MVTAIIANSICTIMYYNRLRVLISYTALYNNKDCTSVMFSNSRKLTKSYVHSQWGLIIFKKAVDIWAHLCNPS